MCVHSEVSKEREGKIVDSKCYGLTASYIRERAAHDDSTPVCQYYEGFNIEGKESTLPSGVYSIDDLKQYGRERNWCPYFLSRFAVSWKHLLYIYTNIKLHIFQIIHSQIIVFSYHYLLDPKIADIVSKELAKESVVVFDEAHNIDNVCVDSMSVKINRRMIDRSTSAIGTLEKYVSEYD
jgi:DNA excision repair protein ERCC-2